jgi:hypothetical protein
LARSQLQRKKRKNSKKKEGSMEMKARRNQDELKAYNEC